MFLEEWSIFCHINLKNGNLESLIFWNIFVILKIEIVSVCFYVKSLNLDSFSIYLDYMIHIWLENVPWHMLNKDLDQPVQSDHCLHWAYRGVAERYKTVPYLT